MSRIALMLPDLRAGGAERVFVTLAREFGARGHDVSFVLSGAKGELLEEARGLAAIHDLRVPRIRHVPASLARHLRAHRPDVLLAAMWPLTGAAMAGRALSRTATPVVLSERNDFRHVEAISGLHRRLLPTIMPLATRGARAIIAVSDGVRESLVETAGLARDRITVINNPIRPVPNPVPKPEDLDALAPWLAAPRRLIAIGSLKRQKGFDVALAALADLPDAHLLILGEGGARAALEAQARALGVASRLHMPGFRPEPARYLAHAHLFVLSSRYEGFVNVVLDALAMGVPVVATDCQSGPSDILEGGRHGTLVAVGDAAALARGIETELATPRDPAALRARAADFTPAAVAARYLAVLGV